MKETTVPDVFLDKKQETQSVGLHLYQSEDEKRQRVLFSQNVISFLMDGTKEVFLDQEPIVIDSSQFMLFSSTRCIMVEKSSEKKAYQSMLLFFEDSFLERFKIKYQKSIQRQMKTKAIAVFKYDEYISNFRTSLLFILRLQKKTDNLLQTKCEEILLYLCGKYPAEMSSLLAQNHSDNEIQFKKVIENNILSNVTMDELAFLCKMSISSFKRNFEKYYKSSPGKWLLQERMKLAGVLLQKKQTPAEVYNLFGYETYSNFAKAFKKEHQVSPKQFQEMNF